MKLLLFQVNLLPRWLVDKGGITCLCACEQHFELFVKVLGYFIVTDTEAKKRENEYIDQECKSPAALYRKLLKNRWNSRCSFSPMFQTSLHKSQSPCNKKVRACLPTRICSLSALVWKCFVDDGYKWSE